MSQWLAYYNKTGQSSDLGLVVDNSIGGLKERKLILKLEVGQQLVNLFSSDNALGRRSISKLGLGSPSITLLFDHVAGNLAAKTGGYKVS